MGRSKRKEWWGVVITGQLRSYRIHNAEWKSARVSTDMQLLHSISAQVRDALMLNRDVSRPFKSVPTTPTKHEPKRRRLFNYIHQKRAKSKKHLRRGSNPQPLDDCCLMYAVEVQRATIAPLRPELDGNMRLLSGILN
jgi:hypothetical protein